MQHTSNQRGDTMKAIISRQNLDGSYAEVGTSNRMVIGHMKTERGVLRFEELQDVDFDQDFVGFYSGFDLPLVKYCPWCGKLLQNLEKENFSSALG